MLSDPLSDPAHRSSLPGAGGMEGQTNPGGGLRWYSHIPKAVAIDVKSTLEEGGLTSGEVSLS